MKTVAFILIFAVVGLFGGSSTSHAQTNGTVNNGNFTYNCTSSVTVGYGTYPGTYAYPSPPLDLTTINGNITVNGHCTLILQFAYVTGNIQVQNGGSLLISAYGEPTTIDGNVQATNCVTSLLEGNVTVKGNYQIQNCTGTAASSWSGFQGPGVVINGNFQCQNNAGGCEAWLGKITGDMQISNNRDGGATKASDISLNTVGGNLQCQSDALVPTHSHGYNWVTGNVQGQCGAGFTPPKDANGSLSTEIGVSSQSGVASCAALSTLLGPFPQSLSDGPVPNTVITSVVDDTALTPSRCIVNGYVNQRVSPFDNCTYADRFQLALPTAWNGRFVAEGGSGSEGSVPAATGSESGTVANGYAVATQDGGHENSVLASCSTNTSNQEFYLDPMAALDNAFQSIDVTALNAKYLVAVYYGNEADHAYWVGCSTGGRQAMVMSQNFPQYFDGIVAGDPVYDIELINLDELWAEEQVLNAYTTYPGGTPSSTGSPPVPLLYPAFSTSDQSLFETALLQTCDALDGVADGVIDNLPACQTKFNPSTATYVSGGTTYPLQCRGAKDATCLTPEQIQAVENTVQGPRSNGQPVEVPAGAVALDHATNTIPGYAYDSGMFSTAIEPLANIGSPTTPGANEVTATNLAYVFLSPPNVDPSFLVFWNDPFKGTSFNFNTDLGQLAASFDPTVPGYLFGVPAASYSTSLDISKFISYGHKIVWYHGLGDPHPPVLETINYYNEMANRNGGLAAAQNFSRLYPVPGMDHCNGGPTTDQFDFVAPIVGWVENGTSPGPVTASGVNFNAATYQVGFVSGPPDNAPTARSRPLCPYPQEAHFSGPTTAPANATGGGGPVAANPSDLANPAAYICTTYSATPYDSTPTTGNPDP